MKFRCEKFQRLRVHGVGQFVNGVLETDDEDAIARIKRVADRYGITAVGDRSEPFDPSAHNRDTVNAYLATASERERIRVLDAERAGKARSTILEGPHGVTTGEPVTPEAPADVDDPSTAAPSSEA